MRVNEKIIDQYGDLVNNLKDIIDMNGLKIVDIVEGAGLNRATFYNKMQKKSFTVQEMKKIAETINRIKA